MLRLLLLVFLFLVSPSGVLAAFDQWPPAHAARDVFARMPDTIFENTPAGLMEEEKQELLAKGVSEFWEVRTETETLLELSSLPFRDIGVLLNVFHYDDKDEVLAVLGTEGSSVCAMEIWKEDVDGRIVPVDPPDSPEVAEFFIQQPDFAAAQLEPSVFMCARPGGLEARVIFWGPAGMEELPVDNTIWYYWRGQNFEKVILPRQPAP